jgi:hypothetical protein
MQELFGRSLNSFAYFRLLAERLIEFEEGRVLAFRHVGGQGRRSGLDLALAGSAHLFEVCGGKVERLVVSFDRDRALAELGLSDRDDTANSERFQPARLTAPQQVSRRRQR